MRGPSAQGQLHVAASCAPGPEQETTSACCAAPATSKRAGVHGRGFTLIELMTVAALIGIIASIAIPTFSIFTCRSKQTEARSILASIVTAEEAYRSEYDSYAVGLLADTTILCLAVRGSKGRYVYDIQGTPAADGNVRVYKAVASGLRDMSGDVMETDNTKVIVNTIDLCKTP